MTAESQRTVDNLLDLLQAVVDGALKADVAEYFALRTLSYAPQEAWNLFTAPLDDLREAEKHSQDPEGTTLAHDDDGAWRGIEWDLVYEEGMRRAEELRASVRLSVELAVSVDNARVSSAA